jgi:hypothetical protein
MCAGKEDVSGSRRSGVISDPGERIEEPAPAASEQPSGDPVLIRTTIRTLVGHFLHDTRLNRYTT